MSARLVKFILESADKAVKTDFAQNLARDLKSLRALWNWIYMGLYVWICIYAVLYYPETIPIAITVTGGVVSVIFTGYVCTKTYEKVRNGNHLSRHSQISSPPAGVGSPSSSFPTVGTTEEEGEGEHD